MRKGMIAVVVAVALMLPVAVQAHEGHTHKLLGTVTSAQGKQVEV